MHSNNPTSKSKSDPKPSDQSLFSRFVTSPVASLTVRFRRPSDQGYTRSKMSPTNARLKRKISTRNLKNPAKVSKSSNTMERPTPSQLTTEQVKEIFSNILSDQKANSAFDAERQRLVDAEFAPAWDSPDKVSKGASEDIQKLEWRVAKLVRAIREYERDVTFGNKASEDIPGPETRDMGGQFLTNKPRIEQNSLLYRISHSVPKGALLHLHFNAELNPERLLEVARGKKNMYVWSIKPLLNAYDLETTEMVFKVMPITTKSCDIFKADYEGEGKNCNKAEFNNRVWMRWDEFREEFKARFPDQYKQPERDSTVRPGPRTCSESVDVDLEPAEFWIKQKMVLSETEAYNPEQTVNGVWARFNQATRCFKGLLNYEQVYKWYIGEAIDRLIDEKIMYAELRPMLMDKSIPTDDGTGSISNSQQMRLIVDCVREKQQQLKDTKQFPFVVKVIYCTPRSIPPAKMQSEMQDCIQLKREYPDLICGFDLVGAEDRPNSIKFYSRELRAFQDTCKQLGLEIPFLFHAGETLLDMGGSSDPANSNLYDSVALQAKRIGHGFSLMKHPELVKRFRPTEPQYDRYGNVMVKGRPGICVELCPISNELLHLCRNIKEHPYPELLAAGVPCCVNSDNPSLFSNSMCHEFYQIMVGCPTMSIYSWKQLALWSLEYSCLNEAQQTEGKEIYLESFQKFCERVIDHCDVLVKKHEDGNYMLEDGNFVIDNEEAAKMYADLPDLDIPKL